MLLSRPLNAVAAAATLNANFVFFCCPFFPSVLGNVVVGGDNACARAQMGSVVLPSPPLPRRPSRRARRRRKCVRCSLFLPCSTATAGRGCVNRALYPTHNLIRSRTPLPDVSVGCLHFESRGDDAGCAARATLAPACSALRTHKSRNDSLYSYQNAPIPP